MFTTKSSSHSTKTTALRTFSPLTLLIEEQNLSRIRLLSHTFLFLWMFYEPWKGRERKGEEGKDCSIRQDSLQVVLVSSQAHFLSSSSSFRGIKHRPCSRMNAYPAIQVATNIFVRVREREKQDVLSFPEVTVFTFPSLEHSSGKITVDQFSL